jgi:hypothetical protein
MTIAGGHFDVSSGQTPGRYNNASQIKGACACRGREAKFNPAQDDRTPRRRRRFSDEDIGDSANVAGRQQDCRCVALSIGFQHGSFREIYWRIAESSQSAIVAERFAEASRCLHAVGTQAGMLGRPRSN